MTTPRIPVYDSRVARFCFFEEPGRDLPLEERIRRLVAFHDFLIREYARILSVGLLAPAIRAFRQRLRPQHFSDEKIIDSLIWSFVNLLRNGALLDNRINYC